MLGSQQTTVLLQVAMQVMQIYAQQVSTLRGESAAVAPQRASHLCSLEMMVGSLASKDVVDFSDGTPGGRRLAYRATQATTHDGFVSGMQY